MSCWELKQRTRNKRKMVFTDFFFTHTVNIFIKFDYREKLSENGILNYSKNHNVVLMFWTAVHWYTVCFDFPHIDRHGSSWFKVLRKKNASTKWEF